MNQPNNFNSYINNEIPDNQLNKNINVNQSIFNSQPTNNNQNNSKKQTKKHVIFAIIIFTIICLILLVTFYFMSNQKNKNLTPETNADISDQLYSDYINNNITTDEYVRYLLYTQYDTSMLDEKYQYLLKTDDAINIEELINKHYEELSTETLTYFAKKINLNNITFEFEKENEETTEDNKLALADLFLN